MNIAHFRKLIGNNYSKILLKHQPENRARNFWSSCLLLNKPHNPAYIF